MHADVAADLEGDSAQPSDGVFGAPNPLRKWRIGRYLRQLRRKAGSAALNGHHNSNVLVTWDETLGRLLRANPPEPPVVKLRTPLPTAAVVMRTWSDESAVLEAVRQSVSRVPRCLVTAGGTSLHTFAPGVPLSVLAPPGPPMADEMVRAIADILVRTVATPADRLPPLPKGWPAGTKSAAFLHHLARHAQDKVYRRHAKSHGGLFDRLGVPHDAMDRFLDSVRVGGKGGSGVGALTERPFGLLHADLHRDNMIVQPNGSLFVLDWELATYGDPLHDLATHLVRMEYGPDELDRVRDAWAEALASRHLSDMARGLETDLPVYIGFEYAQSVYADVIRAANRLGREPDDVGIKSAVHMAGRALERAAKLIGMARVPGDGEIEAALRRWHTDRHRRT
jgi:hypothetical protein